MNIPARRSEQPARAPLDPLWRRVSPERCSIEDANRAPLPAVCRSILIAESLALVRSGNVAASDVVPTVVEVYSASIEGVVRIVFRIIAGPHLIALGSRHPIVRKVR